MTLERWDERLDRLAETVQALTVDVRDGFSETRSNIAALTRLAQLQQDNIEGTRSQFEAAMARMDQAIAELKAGHQRHDAILDYLLRRDGERG
jgi:ABC-type transporter Mla subunit MlaD